MLHITADTHFDQDRIIEFSGIPRAEWEPMILDSINRCVARSDRLIIVGDFAFELYHSINLKTYSSHPEERSR
jgi:calcineurin-like phosphoesterase family protein